MSRYVGRIKSVISASEFRKGTKFLYKGEPHRVVAFQHVKPGKGGAFMKTKMKNMISGSTYEETFRVEEKFEEPNLEVREMQFLYQEGDEYHFMDQENYEQTFLNKKQLDDVIDFLKEQEIYVIVYFEDRPIDMTPPIFMELLVTETPPGVRGNTAQGGATKAATVETGLVLQVPLFVNEGDVIKVDTRESLYVERVNK